MEKKYESLTLFEFQKLFPDDHACHKHLAQLKWPDGFICGKCGHTHYCKGKLTHTRQCTKCGYQATPASHTLFHKVKFPILKAFYIVYFIATNKQGIPSTELSRKSGPGQKTCWRFKRKVMKAMAGSHPFPMLGKVEADETVTGQQEESTRGRKSEDKKLVVVAIERESKGIRGMYARVIKDGSNDSLKRFFEAHIDSKAAIKTDEFQITNNLRIATFFTVAQPRILSTFEHCLSACFNKPIFTRKINWKLIMEQYDQMIKYTTALKLGTATAEAIMKRFTRNNLQHPTYKQGFAGTGKSDQNHFSM